MTSAVNRAQTLYRIKWIAKRKSCCWGFPFDRDSYTHTHTHTHTSNSLTHAHTYNKDVHTHIHKHVHTQIQKYTHTHIFTYVRIPAHTHSHITANVLDWSWCKQVRTPVSLLGSLSERYEPSYPSTSFFASSTPKVLALNNLRKLLHH